MVKLVSVVEDPEH